MDFTIGDDYTHTDLVNFQQGSEYSMQNTNDFEIGRSALYFVNLAGATEYTFVLTGMTGNESVWTLAWLAE